MGKEGKYRPSEVSSLVLGKAIKSGITSLGIKQNLGGGMKLPYRGNFHLRKADLPEGLAHKFGIPYR